MDAPILKKDLYAILILFLQQDDSKSTDSQSLKWAYDDMFGYDNYMALFATRPEWLCPIHQNFYPNAYVTRQEFINLLMLVDGIPMQVSTSMHVSERIDIPKELLQKVPSAWASQPLGYVTKVML